MNSNARHHAPLSLDPSTGRRLRILYLASLYTPYVEGGAELAVQNQAEAMAARGHDVCVLTIGPHRSRTENSIGGVRVVREPFCNLYFHDRQQAPTQVAKILWHLIDSMNYPMARRAAAFARQYSPDVVVAHNLPGWSAVVIPALRSAGFPVVQVLHDQYDACIRSVRFRRGRTCEPRCAECKLLRFRHQELTNQLSAVVGVSEFILQRFRSEKYFDHVPILQVIHNTSASNLPDLCDLRPRPLSPSKLTLGYLGTLSEQKGVRFLLKALDQWATPNLQLRIGGRGEATYEAELKSEFKNSRFSFLGYVRPDEFFPSIDALVVPSLVEDTFPTVIFEAFGYGVPVIGSSIGGIPELIQPDINGYLIEPGSDTALKEKVNLLLNDGANLTKLASQSRDTAHRFFDVSARTTVEENLLRQVSGKPKHLPNQPVSSALNNARACVSVIIPTLDGRKTLARALDSVVANSYYVKEVLLVLSNSPASMHDYAQSLGEKYPLLSIRIIDTGVPSNGAIARNAGIMNAAAPFVAFLDDDDEWFPAKMENYFSRHDAANYPNNLVIFSTVLSCREDLTNLARFPLWPYRGGSITEFVMHFAGGAQTSSLLLKTKLARQALFDPDLIRHQDYDFCMRLEALGARFEWIQEPTSYWYQRGSTVTKGATFEFCSSWIMRRKLSISRRSFVRYIAKELFQIARSSKQWKPFLTFVRENLSPIELAMVSVSIGQRLGSSMIRRSFSMLRGPADSVRSASR